MSTPKRFCRQCGGQIGMEDKFCLFCGAKQPESVRAVIPAESAVSRAENVAEAANVPAESAVSQAENAAEAASVPVESAVSEYNLYDNTEAVTQDFSGDMPTEQPSVQAETAQIAVVEKKQGGAAGFFRHFGSVIFCLLGMSFAIALISIIAVRSTLAEESITAAVEGIDIAELPVGEFIDMAGLSSGLNIDGDATFAELIYNNLSEKQKDRYNITKRDVEKIMENEKIKELVAEKLSELGSVLIGKSSDDEIFASDEILRFIKKNSDEIESEIGYTLSEFDYEVIEENLAGLERVGEVDDMLGAAGVSLSFVSTLFGIPAIIVLSVIVAAFAALILLVNKRHMFAGFTYLGVLCIITGLLSIAIGITQNVIISAPLIKQLFGPFLAPSGSLFIITGLVLIAVFALDIAIVAVVKSVKRKKALNTNL